MIVGISILLVDDVPGSQESSASLLDAEGYEVSRAADGDEALRELSQRRPAAVLFQILQPANAMIDFVRRMALTRQAAFVPVVVLTALNEFQVGSFLNGVPGVRRIFYSPCPPEVLREAVAQAVRYSQAK
jgi:CheY-like chemotaxis protein